jgi:asparagine synthase (glutamine-hydrolysing)
MCGIAGFIDKTQSQEDLAFMTRAICNRGPDDEGFYLEGGIGLGHRRLSIIDLSESGHQPMFFDDLILIFNGEIYNYQEIRKELEAKGYQFISHSDTEVLLKAFRCWGTSFVERFIGMFAFALYDKKDKTLYLYRDRVGVKPLYYYAKNNRFAFGSELKALRQYLDLSHDSRLNDEAVSLFFQLGYIAGNDAIVDGVKKVPPGHFLKYANGHISLHKYWDVSFNPDPSWENRKDDDVLDELEQIIISAFSYRMVADVPVGVFLSAGIDSSLVAAVLRKHHGAIKTFTIGFKEAEFDESVQAAEIAAYLKTDHHSAILGPEKALQILQQFYNIYDEPHGDNSCVPTTFVSSLAKSHGAKVVLSADGGDELFGGYSRYTEYYNRWKQVNRFAGAGRMASAAMFRTLGTITGGDRGNKLHRFADLMGKKEFHEFYQAIMFSSSKKERRSLLPNYREVIFDIKGNNLQSQMMDFDFRHYLVNNNLVKVDRATMFNSIEGREPFLDHRIIEFSAKLPNHFKIRNGVKKYILRKLLGRYLPEHLCNLPKRGFGAPLQQWIQHNFKDNLHDIFIKSPVDNPYLDKKYLHQMLDGYFKDKPTNMVLLWLTYSFQLWYKKWTTEK